MFMMQIIFENKLVKLLKCNIFVSKIKQNENNTFSILVCFVAYSAPKPTTRQNQRRIYRIMVRRTYKKIYNTL